MCWERARYVKLFACNISTCQGENLSPLLVAVFLDDFERFVSHNYKRLDETLEPTGDKVQ